MKKQTLLTITAMIATLAVSCTNNQPDEFRWQIDNFDDIKVLLDVLRQLVEQGNTVIIIEHNLDVLKSVDYIFDMGPEGGKKGGLIVAQGTPEKLADNPDSVTGPFLKEIL